MVSYYCVTNRIYCLLSQLFLCYMVVEQVTLEVAWEITQKVDNTVTKKPGVFFHTFNESSIDFNVVLHCSKFADQFKLKHEFIKALTKRYRQEGIEIPFPIRTVYNHSVHEEA